MTVQLHAIFSTMTWLKFLLFQIPGNEVAEVLVKQGANGVTYFKFLYILNCVECDIIRTRVNCFQRFNVTESSHATTLCGSLGSWFVV